MTTEERLREMIISLRQENSMLKGELGKAETALDESRFRIRQELEPRIRREDQAYDMWITSPSREEPNE